MRIQFASLFVSVALTACVLPPKDATHPQPLAAERVGLTGAAFEPAPGGWWDSFQDPQLDRLIRLGLKTARRWPRARPAWAKRWRRHNRRTQDCCRAPAWMRGPLYQRAPANYVIPPPLAGHSFWMAQAGASLGWDIDFWGRRRMPCIAHRRSREAARLDVDDARLMIAGAIAQALYRAVP